MQIPSMIGIARGLQAEVYALRDAIRELADPETAEAIRARARDLKFARRRKAPEEKK